MPKNSSSINSSKISSSPNSSPEGLPNRIMIIRQMANQIRTAQHRATSKRLISMICRRSKVASSSSTINTMRCPRMLKSIISLLSSKSINCIPFMTTNPTLSPRVHSKSITCQSNNKVQKPLRIIRPWTKFKNRIFTNLKS